MANLGQSNAVWARLWREFAEAGLSPIRLLREIEDYFRLERTQVWNLGDRASATPHITALTFSGVNYGVNTSSDGKVIWRFVANGGNWDVTGYTASGASGAVTKATNVAAEATGSLVAQNSSGLTGSITLGATIVGDITDLHYALIQQDVKARLKNIFTGTDSIEDDEFSRAAYSTSYDLAAANIRNAIEQIKSVGVQRWALAGPGNPRARGNKFLLSTETSMITDVAVNDGSDNVTRKRTGFFPTLSAAMRDEATGSEQDILRVVPTGAAGSFISTNDGLGAVASHTPSEACPPLRVTFKCIKGIDTGDLGAEQFSATYAMTSTGDDRGEIVQEGPVVGKSWAGKYGFGPITITRTHSKTNDGSNLRFAAASGAVVTGITNSNSNEGVLYVTTVANGSNWDISFFSASSRATSSLVAKATNIAASAAFTASEQNSSGLTIAWTMGGTVTATSNIDFDVNGFYVNNAQTPAVQDEFSVTVTLAASPGLTQTIIADEWTGASLNSDTSGSELLSDNYVKRGTFPAFITQDN